MAFGDDTAIDAPVTPAPVFAYRALRAVFWGDEDTPQQAPKRAILEPKHGASQFNTAANDMAIQLTPGQKRKHSTIVQPSPTKSILRAPGAHTPRRALLKDINVKFKDLRKSVSPELARKESTAAMQARVHALDDKENRDDVILTRSAGIESHDVREEKQRVGSLKTSTGPVAKPLLPLKSDGALPKSISTNNDSSAPLLTLAEMDSISSFDPEAYRRTTEKEMKKLIKYGQKMREYARRQDEENNKLRALLEDMRKENERLQKELTVSDTKKGSVRQDNESLNEAAIRDRLTGKRPNEVSDGKKITIRNHRTENVTNLSKPDQKPTQQPQHRAGSKRPLHDFDLDHITGRHSKSTNQIPIHKASPPKKPRRQENLNPTNPRPEPRSTLESAEQNLALRPLTNGTNSTRLAPDRLAAARARVRQKAELRKASADVDTDPIAARRGVDTDMVGIGVNISKMETSLVDWAGL